MTVTSSKSPATFFSVKDADGSHLVDKVLDRAGAKGTGKWMSQLALDLGVPSTLVTEAVYARSLSARKDERERASKVLQGPDAKYTGDKKAFVEQIRQALFASKIVSYAQGFVQMQAAAAEHDWPLNYGDCAMLWRGGCIIRAVLPRQHQRRLRQRPAARKPAAGPVLQRRRPQCSRRLAARPSLRLPPRGIPVPAFATALAYYDGYRRATVPAKPTASSTRLLRRPHLRTHRQTPRRDVSYRLAGFAEDPDGRMYYGL